jgi:hypothetical protein
MKNRFNSFYYIKKMTSLEKAILLIKKIVTNPSSLKKLMDYEDIYQKHLRSKYQFYTGDYNLFKHLFELTQNKAIDILMDTTKK